MSYRGKLVSALVSTSLFLLSTYTAVAQDLSNPNALAALCLGASKCVSASITVPKVQSTPSWMSPDVGAAWSAGYKGQGVTITVVDDFSSASRFSGNLGLGTQYQRHGEWTREESSLLAPRATMKSKDFSTSSSVPLSYGLNVLNLSYGMYAKAGYGVGNIGWSNEESSIIAYATNGNAVISKAAGNDAIPVGSVNSSGQQDYLDLALIGKQSAIFVGSLNNNGTTTNGASMAWYSNTAGSNTSVQSHFLVVGVSGSTTGLYGTSFAAPIISGYAAIIGSKFPQATPTDITNRLLNTARTDTLLKYTPAIYGKGEASLSRALAPSSIR